MTTSNSPDWNSFSRANASQKWRKQSAAMGSGMTEAIVAAAKVAPGMRVLDIACGTGEPSITIARLLQGTGEVVGVDLSGGPLAVASERAKQHGLSNVRFQEADVHHLPFPDNSFDRITSRLGVMFFADLPQALREMHRVLKPGGRVTLLAWGKFAQPYFATTIGTVLKILPDLKLSPAGKSMNRFGTADVLGKQLREAGFVLVEENLTDVQWTWPGTAEEVWEYFQDVAVPFQPTLHAIPDQRKGEIDKAVLDAMKKYQVGDEVRFTAHVNITTAEKKTAQ
jgi:ubiquinone/menaquinone biosynthesis C-methylase UbiE